MKLYPLTVAVIAATAIAGASTTAHAGPVEARPAPSVHASEHGITYTTAAAMGGRGAITTLDGGGRFVPAADGMSVALTDAEGIAVATIPLGLHTASGLVGLTASIANSGRTLTLTRQSATAPVRAVDQDAGTLARKQHNAVVGALVGGGIGAVLGFFLGGVGALVTVPIGAGIGALIGFSTP
ncbi:hypothetical protein [Nocardia miyunensis]|uniref:hypothetical protein n=1 Tax=Nocardia miyunensis TaxID=282684 RepID=UPI00082E75C1|nr:hypothetical protein [Nocardia miyunensis]